VTEIARLSHDEVLTIRRRLATTELAKKSTFGMADPLRPDALSSAVSRQWTAHGQTLKYRTIADVGATLFYGIAMAHAFENGNKRTAMMALFVFLDRNRRILVDTTEDELYEFAAQVADHRLEIPAKLERNADSEVLGIARWLRTRMKPIPSGDRLMRFSELRKHLEALGCSFEDPDRNFLRIHNGPYTVKTGYPRADFNIAVNEIKRIRKSLHLDASHGVNTQGFYDLESSVDRFVQQHIDLMTRLADL
jgi:death-on-curing family protein